MRHRRIFMSLCLIGAAFEADLAAQTLGRPPAPAVRMQNWSYGSWTDLPDAWGYFPPSGIAERQNMIGWADRIRVEAWMLERSLTGSRPGTASADELVEVRSIRMAADLMRQDLVHGVHMALMRERLFDLASALESQTLRKSESLRIQRFLESNDRTFEKIAISAGPWPSTPRIAERGRGSDQVVSKGRLRMSKNGDEPRSPSGP
jgi:hypothetical protein